MYVNVLHNMVKLTTVIITLYVFSSASSCSILVLRVVTVSESIVFLSVDSPVSTLLRFVVLSNTVSLLDPFTRISPIEYKYCLLYVNFKHTVLLYNDLGYEDEGQEHCCG